MIPIAKSDLRLSLDQESLLRRITNRIRRTLELEDIITTTTTEARSLLGTDRVMIYKFHGDRSGQVIAESIHENRLPSLLGLNFPADDIPPHARELFIKSRVRSVVNIETQQIGHSPLRGLETGELISEEIHYRPVDPCHVEYLTAMGVKSSLVAPILHQDELWGLLVSHNSETHLVSESELEAVQMVVDQLSVAIAQSYLLTQAREKAEREAIINRIATLLHSLPTIVLQPAVEAAVAAFGGSGGRLCIRNEALNLQNGKVSSLAECLIPGSDCIKLYTCGQQPVLPEQTIYPLIEQYNVWQEHYKSGEYDVWAISDIYQTPSLRTVQIAFQGTKIRSILMIPLQYRQQLVGYFSIFRNEIDTETLWAGQFDPDQRQLYPRLSFEVWRETKTAQVQQWTAEEVEMAREIGKHFASAIQQYELYQQVQAFNNSLEKQIHRRTVELRRTAEQQQAVFGVIAKIRESLDTNTIFQITTKEVCQLIKADRVSIYRFDSEWGGQFVGDFEVASPHWSNDTKLGISLVWNDTYLQDTQGGRYRHNETFAVDDIYKMGFTQCHIDNLEEYHIHAFVLAPIFVGQQLWGLLTTYQHSGPRQWKASEVNFISQIAAQLGVALQQADLLTKTQQQTQKLTQALHDLQETQTQLIQTEKMSSLGQLVAGIAHEINNPVNFIYGNLAHVSDYTEDLLEMLALYKQHFVSPSPEIRERAEEIDLEFLIGDLPKTLSSMKVGIDRIRQIVLGLRNFSRLDEAEMKAVNIHEGIDNTLLILQHRLKAKPESPAIKLVKDYGELPLVECYAGQLNQVFMNVLSNAIDALEDYKEPQSETYSSTITIHTAVGEIRDNVESVVIRIVDNGPGIPEALRARICDPFFTTKPVGKGTGLGLSISYKIVVDKHGGVFKCDSQPGLGTEFWIEIPIRQDIYHNS
ncbi:MAG: GAF domain-containing protein [Mojavia pulchra JT2-VF2]|jgi:light-regulated signal transduction histidine kinase (bacteriophytochrome)|uniref:histidine kinase n=1 Tax=Mojavia pulchra JT2-VF2 TaxID=287848 RepID=A0A951Q4M6_9NOST|nr:GAF domain-containing protein [Mojavia pulchra JT2-VF2]